MWVGSHDVVSITEMKRNLRSHIPIPDTYQRSFIAVERNYFFNFTKVPTTAEILKVEQAPKRIKIEQLLTSHWRQKTSMYVSEIVVREIHNKLC